MVRVLIIEDEILAAQRLTKILAELAPDFEIVGQCDSIEMALEYFSNNNEPDLVFLDIQLGDGLSFEIFERIELHCPVIFCTAYDEYVFRAFELNSIDFLMKPINKEALAKSIEKYRKLNLTKSIDYKQIVSWLQPNKAKFKQRFLVGAGASILSIKTEDVAYFYSVEGASFLVNNQNKSYAIDFSLDKVEEMLCPENFFRANRQFLLGFDSIKKIHIQSKSRIKLEIQPTPTCEVIVSKARTHEFRLWLDR